MTETFVHNGYTVTLTDDYQFMVNNQDINRVFSSAQAARDAIDERVKALAAQQRHANKLALEAIAENGEHCIIRGINLNTKELLGVPQNKDRFGSHVYVVYPPEPWIAAALKRLATLKRECAVLDKRLRKFQVDRGAAFGRLDADKYDQAIAAFTARWAALCQEAAAEALQEP